MAKTKLARHNKFRNYGLALGSFIIAFILGTTLIAPVFDRRFDVFNIYSQNKEFQSIGDDIPKPYIYWQAPKNSIGIDKDKEINVTFYRNWLNTTVVWSLQKSTDNIKWIDCTKLLIVDKVWNPINLSEKHTLTWVADEDAYYQLLLKIDDVKTYQDLSASKDNKQDRMLLNYSITSTEDYNIYYDWSDYSKSAESSKTSMDKSISSVGSKQQFSWKVYTSQKLAKGEKFSIDPTFGSTTHNSDSTYTIENYQLSGYYQMSGVAGTADSITAYLTVGSSYNSPCKAKLYNGVDGSAVLNGNTAETTVSATGWATFTFTGTKPILVADAYYYLVVYGTSGTGTCVFSYSTSGTSKTNRKSGTYGTWSTAWTSTTSVDSSSTPRIYCTYTSTTLIDTYTINGVQGLRPDMLRLGTSEYYLNAYQGTDTNGWVNTTRVYNDNGTIKKATIDSLEFETVWCYGRVSVCNVYGDIYAVVYRGPDVVAVKTFQANAADGQIGAAYIDTLDFKYPNDLDVVIKKVSGNMFAVAYSNTSHTGGWLETCYIANDGTISNTRNDTVRFATSCGSLDMISLDSNTVAIVYSGASSANGYIVTYNITASNGDITNTNASWWNYDTTSGWENVKLVSGNVYAIAYRDGSGYIQVKTVTIATTGAITKSWIDTLAVDTGNYFPYLFTVNASSVYGVTYRGVDDDGWLRTFSMTADGQIGAATITFIEFDNADSQNLAPISWVNKSWYYIAYAGTSNKLKSCTVYIKTNYASPTLATAQPTNGSTGISLTPKCNITINDLNGDAMTLTWQENSTGSYVTRQVNSSCVNGTYRWTDTYATAYNTKYWWKVSVNDTKNNVTAIYNFRTRPENSPTFATPLPANASTGIPLTPKTNITVTDADGDSMTLNWYNNKTGSWVNYGHNNTVGNGTYRQTETWASANNQKYYWKVYANDGINNVSTWYYFTTALVRTWQTVNTWNGTIYNQSSFNQIVDFNGTIFNSSNFNQINLFNGSIYNESVWSQVNLWNGTLFNTSQWNIIDEYNGTIYNTSGFKQIALWNGSIFNTSTYIQINLWNGTLYNQSGYHLINEYNGSIFNVSLGFALVNEWNGSLYNQSLWNQVDLWNGTVYNASNYYLIQDWNGTLYNQSQYYLINQWNGSLYNISIGFVLVNDWNGSIYNQSSWQDQEWNGTVFNTSAFIQVSLWNGSIFNQSGYHLIQDWNGSIYNVSIGFVLVNDWNGTIWNQSIWQDIDWNGTIFNASSYHQIALWNGSLFNASSWHQINLWNGSLYNISIGWIQVQDWNGSIYNQSSWQDTEWNGSIYNTSGYNQINLWNGTIFNQSAYHIVQEFNGSIYNISIGFIPINDLNGTIYNQSSWQDQEWNGSIYNASGYSQINLWNGTLFNQSNYHLIQEFNGTIYNVSIGYIIVNDWNGSIWNQSTWNLIEEWYGSIYNQTAYNEIQDWNGSIYNQSQSNPISTWNGSIYNTSSFNAINDWNGTIFNSSSFNPIDDWNGSIFNASNYYPIQDWNGTIYNISIGFILVQNWNGSIYNQSSWSQVSLWNGTVFNTSAFEIINDWNGTVYNQSQSSTINLWNGTIYNISIGFTLVQDWNGTIYNLTPVNIINDWNGSIYNTTGYLLIQNWNGTIYNQTISNITLSNPHPSNTIVRLRINTTYVSGHTADITISITRNHTHGLLMNTSIWFNNTFLLTNTSWGNGTIDFYLFDYWTGTLQSNYVYNWTVNCSSVDDAVNETYSFTPRVVKTGFMFLKERDLILSIAIGAILSVVLGLVWRQRRKKHND